MATLYKKEREQFNEKYRYFQLHKWEILKGIKQNLLEQKLKEVEKRRMVRQWLTIMELRNRLVRTFQVFDRERFLIARRAKMLPIYLHIKVRLRKQVLHFGPKYPLREQRYVKFSSMGLHCFLRPILRERAKAELTNFLRLNFEKSVILAKFQKYLQVLIMLQRIFRIRYYIKKRSTRVDTAGKN